jgi:purine-nucleoside phosphorylase
MQEVVLPIRVMAGLGVGTVIVTSAAGAINRSFKPGDLVAISDHINLMGDNPLRGTTDFVDLTEVYSSRLRRLAREAAHKLGLTLRSGVYTALSGPCYETPAEIRALAALGGDTVGMSTVPEAIMARSLGLEVLGLNLITNPAAGLAQRPLSHQEVLEVSARASGDFKALVREIINLME